MLIYTSRSIFFLHFKCFFNLSQRICFNLIQTNSLYPSINVTANLKATETCIDSNLTRTNILNPFPSK